MQVLTEASVDEAGRGRLNGVDVLRGLSVLLVTLHHIHLRFWLNDYDVDSVFPKTVNQVLFWSGYYAVIVFFVISGFLITGLSIRRWGQLGHIHIGRFYRLRAARILPCLLALLLVLSALHLSGDPTFRIPAERASLGQALWAALTFHINWLEGRHGYLPGTWDVLWSLSVEEVFYLLFPVICLILRRDTVLLLPLACLARPGADQSYGPRRSRPLGTLRLSILHGCDRLRVSGRNGRCASAAQAANALHGSWCRSGNRGLRDSYL